MKRTQKAIKLSLFGVAAILALVNAPIFAKEINTPKEQAVAIFGPFFTDPNYEVTVSFRDMCCQAIPYLEQSGDADLQELAKALRKVCNQSKITLLTLASALVKFTGSIQQHFGNPLPTDVLKARLAKALKI